MQKYTYRGTPFNDERVDQLLMDDSPARERLTWMCRWGNESFLFQRASAFSNTTA